MSHDARAYFLDVEDAAMEIAEYTSNLTLAAYLSDGRTRRAVERCLEIIGEALAQLRKRDETLVAAIGEHHQLIGLRNVLIHEYGKVDDALIWQAIQQKLPRLLASVSAELERIGR